MADVLNLNRFRKRKRRAAELEQAERNRAVHGRSKADKRKLGAQRELDERVLSGHQREHSADSTGLPAEEPSTEDEEE